MNWDVMSCFVETIDHCFFKTIIRRMSHGLSIQKNSARIFFTARALRNPWMISSFLKCSAYQVPSPVSEVAALPMKNIQRRTLLIFGGASLNEIDPIVSCNSSARESKLIVVGSRTRFTKSIEANMQALKTGELSLCDSA